MVSKALAKSIFAIASLLAVGAGPGGVASAEDAAELTPQQVQFFENKVRPVLAKNCYECHGPDEQESELRLDQRSGILAGGENYGPAIVPGKPQESILIDAINYGELEMPPEHKLKKQEIADLTRWVEMGAPWPGADTTKVVQQEEHGSTVTDEDRSWWSFQPVRRPELPQLDATGQSWARNPIDSFIYARLAARQLRPSPPAPRRELIRRVYFDLLGLPPSPKEIEAYLADDAPDAYERLVDRLLSAPQYGERWGRHWLDLVRFSQSNGYERDDEKPFAWRYRDYVIRSLNEDKPYNQFVKEQLAGDEFDKVTDDSLTATAFYRLGVWDDEPDDLRQAYYDGLDDMLVATSTTFLGLTVGCARCHAHKFDPIPHEDYYRLLAFFRNVKFYCKPDDPNAPTTILGQLPSGIGKTLIVGEYGPTPKETFVFIRGSSGSPSTKVEPRFPEVLSASTIATVPQLPSQSSNGKTTGRRRVLAEWIANENNPLTARVMVNRLWHYHFGRGIVATPSDFGKVGMKPTHPLLLDWLASEAVHGDWRLKTLHRLIMTSATYRQSSRIADFGLGIADSKPNPQSEIPNPKSNNPQSNNPQSNNPQSNNPQSAIRNPQSLDPQSLDPQSLDPQSLDPQSIDPGNELLWRQNMRRLEAEAIRDFILATSGQLNRKMGGQSFYPRMPADVIAGQSMPGRGWNRSSRTDRSRRGVYIFSKRGLLLPLLESFDLASSDQPIAARSATTVAPQALTLMNSKFLTEQSHAFANRVLQASGDDRRKLIRLAYSLALGRSPTEREQEIASAYIDRQSAAFRENADVPQLRPGLPSALHQSYLAKNRAEDFLLGPRAGWSYFRGEWPPRGDGIHWVNSARGPYALWNGYKFRNGSVSCRISMDDQSELVAIMLRAVPQGQVFHGYELLLDPRQDRVSLVRHAENTSVLASVANDALAGMWHTIKFEANADRLRVWMNDREQPLFDITDSDPTVHEGRIGLRTWGGALLFPELNVEANGQSMDVLQTDPVASPDQVTGARTSFKEWSFFGGQWNRDKEHAIHGETEPGTWSFVTCNDTRIGDGVVQCEMKAAEASDAELVFRVENPQMGVNNFSGYEVAINAGEQLVRLGRHQGDFQIIKDVPHKIEADRWYHVKAEAVGGRIRVYLDGADQPIIDEEDPHPLAAGAIGLRTGRKAAFRAIKLDVLRAELTDVEREVMQDLPRYSPHEKAVAAFCNLLFNMNEFVYID